MFGKRFEIVPDKDNRSCNVCALWELCKICDINDMASPCYREEGRTPIHYELVTDKSK